MNIRMFIGGIRMGRYMSTDTPYVIDAEAHCDGPCGVYDPASARIAGEAVQSMTNKMLTLAAVSYTHLTLPTIYSV